MRSAGSGIRRLAGTGLPVVVVLLSGCALLPQFGEPTPVEPTAANADTTRVQVPDPDLWPTVTELPAEPEPSSKANDTPRSKPRETPPMVPAETVAEAAPVDSLAKEAAPALTVSPPKERLEEVETETLASLREAKKLIGTVDPSKLRPEDQEKLRIVRGLVTETEEALSRQDVPAAAGLARKARLLAVELTSR